MFKKLCIFLIFSKLKVTKLLIDQYRMQKLRKECNLLEMSVG